MQKWNNGCVARTATPVVPVVMDTAIRFCPGKIIGGVWIKKPKWNSKKKTSTTTNKQKRRATETKQESGSDSLVSKKHHSKYWLASPFQRMIMKIALILRNFNWLWHNAIPERASYVTNTDNCPTPTINRDNWRQMRNSCVWPSSLLWSAQKISLPIAPDVMV